MDDLHATAEQRRLDDETRYLWRIALIQRMKARITKSRALQAQAAELLRAQHERRKGNPD